MDCDNPPLSHTCLLHEIVGKGCKRKQRTVGHYLKVRAGFSTHAPRSKSKRRVPIRAPRSKSGVQNSPSTTYAHKVQANGQLEEVANYQVEIPLGHTCISQNLFESALNLVVDSSL